MFLCMKSGKTACKRRNISITAKVSWYDRGWETEPVVVCYRLVRQLDLDLAKDPQPPSVALPPCLLTYTRETLTHRMASKKARG